jgi:predicted nucleotidyltransferase
MGLLVMKKKILSEFPGYSKWSEFVKEHINTGSFHIVDPPVETSDVDVLVKIDALDIFTFLNILNEEEYTSKVFERYILHKNVEIKRNAIDFNNIKFELSRKAEEQDDDYSYLNGKEFISFRHGKYNLIVTTDSKYYDSFLKANIIAKKLNIKDKKVRVDLFNLVTRGDFPENCLGKTEIIRVEEDFPF